MWRPLCVSLIAAGAGALIHCTPPPAGLEPADATAPHDSATPDSSGDSSVDFPGGDGAVVDADGPGDAGAVDASATDAGVYDNPHGIALIDVSLALGGVYLGGRSAGDLFGMGSGAAVGDVDGNGRPDIFLARCDSTSPAGGPSTLLLGNAGSGFNGFTEDTALAGRFQGTCAHGAAFGDIDRDGDLDLFVALDGPDRLYRNNGTGQFSDITSAAGVAGPSDDVNTGAYWADIDLDGQLDLLVLGHARAAPPVSDSRQANRLYRNRGDGVFVDIAPIAGASGDGSSQAAAIADLDGDGDIEIYVANDRYAINGQNGLPGLDADQWLDPVSFDGSGVPSYVDRSADFATDAMRSAMGVALADIDGDDRDDIYVSDWGPNQLHVWNSLLGAYDSRADDWDAALHLTSTNHLTISWAAEFTDFDRDGRQELIVINGSVYEVATCVTWGQSDIIMRRIASPDSFVDITGGTGWAAHRTCPAPFPITEATSTRGVIVADFDDDGADDLLVTPFVERYRLYRNITPHVGRHQLRVIPVGTVSAPTPQGAVLRVTRTDGQVLRRTLYAGGTLAQRYPALEAGLDTQTSVTRATLHWPSGYVQRLDLTPGFAIDSYWRVVEPAWLVLSMRVADPDDVPVLGYRPPAQDGGFLGAAASGRAVSVIRSDGLPTTVVDHGDGYYTVALPHPGVARTTVLQVVDEGVTLAPRLSVYYR